MKKDLNANEIAVMEIMESTDKPVGSWFLQEELESMGIQVSSATVGRILNKLDRLGYLEKMKYKGRVITQLGRDELNKLKTIDELNFHKGKLDDLIDTEILENFLMVLQARKTIERETARLAAENITNDQLMNLEQLVERQEMLKDNRESITAIDIEFHRLIAIASGNMVLASLYNMLATLGQQTDLFQHLRQQVDEPYRSYHRGILEGIKRRDPDLAESKMIEHFEALIIDVNKYWHLIK